MTQEEKELLLKDLCARLPYGVMVGYSGKDNPDTLDKIGKVIYVDIRFGMIQMQDGSGISYGLPPSEFIKPYLRSISSMTEEEKNKFRRISNCEVYKEDFYNEYHEDSEYFTFIDKDTETETFDWLNAHHLDYRGLIEKGLALEAPEGIYNIN